MDLAHWTVVDIIAPIVLLAAFIWVVTRRRNARTIERSEDATAAGYAEEESRRREGSDGL